MKKIVLVTALLMLAALPAFAFSSKGLIPGADGVEYRGLKVTESGVNVTIVNKSGKPLTFSAALTFLSDKKEVADLFIEKISVEPGGQAQLQKLCLKGDFKSARKAQTLKWTVYTVE